jgi:hypothetical protein
MFRSSSKCLWGILCFYHHTCVSVGPLTFFYWANFCHLTTQKRASAIHVKVFSEKKVPKITKIWDFKQKSSYLNNRFQQIAKIFKQIWLIPLVWMIVIVITSQNWIPKPQWRCVLSIVMKLDSFTSSFVTLQFTIL